MKLDYETLQFERQLKRAKRLSLLDYAANERRRKQECKTPKSVVHKKSPRARSAGTDQVIVPCTIKIESQPQQIKRTVSETVNKLKRSAARRIAGRRRLCPKTKRRNGVASRSQLKQNHTSNAESHQYIDMEGCSQLALVDLEAKLEIISSSSLGNIHSTSAECIASENCLNGVVRETILPQPSFRRVNNYIAPPSLGSRLDGFYRYIEKSPEELDDEVEYDMDEEVELLFKFLLVVKNIQLCFLYIARLTVQYAMWIHYCINILSSLFYHIEATSILHHKRQPWFQLFIRLVNELPSIQS